MLSFGKGFVPFLFCVWCMIPTNVFGWYSSPILNMWGFGGNGHGGGCGGNGNGFSILVDETGAVVETPEHRAATTAAGDENNNRRPRQRFGRRVRQQQRRRQEEEDEESSCKLSTSSSSSVHESRRTLLAAAAMQVCMFGAGTPPVAHAATGTDPNAASATIYKSGKAPVVPGQKPKDANKGDLKGTKKDPDFLRSVADCRNQCQNVIGSDGMSKSKEDCLSDCQDICCKTYEQCTFNIVPRI